MTSVPPHWRRTQGTTRQRQTALLGWLALVCAAAITVIMTGSPGAVGEVATLDRGASVYAANCMACHGADGAGVPGTDRTAGTPIDRIDAAYIDLTLRTGRMPLLAPEVGVVPPADGLSDGDREALVAWTIAEWGLPDSRPAEPIVGDIARGHELYAQHCAQCHGATGAGGVSGEGTLILPVIGVDPVAAAEAIRVGPFRMPRFAEGQLDDEEVAHVAVFVDHLTDRATTPIGLFEIDRVAMAVLVIALLVATFGVVLLVSHPVDLSRRRRQAPPEGHK